MAACRAGEILVVTKLDRLARSLTDARDIVALHHAGTHTSAVLAELFSVARLVHRAIELSRTAATAEP